MNSEEKGPAEAPDEARFRSALEKAQAGCDLEEVVRRYCWPSTEGGETLRSLAGFMPTDFVEAGAWADRSLDASGQIAHSRVELIVSAHGGRLCPNRMSA